MSLQPNRRSPTSRACQRWAGMTTSHDHSPPLATSHATSLGSPEAHRNGASVRQAHGSSIIKRQSFVEATVVNDTTGCDQIDEWCDGPLYVDPDATHRPQHR